MTFPHAAACGRMVAWIAFVALLLLSSSADAENSTHTSLSGCQVCAQKGDCSQAYHGGPGKYCGSWLDRGNQRQACCCPSDAVCKVTNYACNCAYAKTPGYYRHDEGYGLLWLWYFLSVLLLLACCGVCCYSLTKKPKEDNSHIPMAHSVSAPGPATYSTADTVPVTYATPGYAAPTYASAPIYGEGYGGYGGGGGGMGAGTGAALGGAAGLLGGLVLGEALADSNHGYGGLDDGGGIAGGGVDGGADIGGEDFGGDF